MHIILFRQFFVNLIFKSRIKIGLIILFTVRRSLFLRAWHVFLAFLCKSFEPIGAVLSYSSCCSSPCQLSDQSSFVLFLLLGASSAFLDMQTRGIEKPLQSCYEPLFLSSKLTNNACFQTFRKELSNQKLDPRDRDNWCFFGANSKHFIS